VHRVRVAVLLRMERQRMQIAMDLHDEIGSGLGSIGILSGLLAGEYMEESRRRQLAKTIVETSGELGNALSDIVWSLRQDAATLEGLAAHIRRRASALFPEGTAELVVDFPALWPESNLPMRTRRNLLLEALHNAARHAEATRVVLRLACEGAQWRLTVSDNGIGRKQHGSDGMGLMAMRRRAEEIDAQLTWDWSEGSGASMSVSFDPSAKKRQFSR